MMKQQRHKQRGASLIASMVGLLIGLASVLAVVSLYLTQSRQIEGSAAEPGLRQTSASNGQIALGLMLLQAELQKAGFRVASPALGTDLVVGNNASGAANALGWHWVESGVDECAAFRYVPTSNAGTQAERGRVDLLRRVSPCAVAPADPTTLFAAAAAADIEILASNISQLNITVEGAHADCQIGVGALTTGARVSMSARLSGAGLPVQNRFCIYNIV